MKILIVHRELGHYYGGVENHIKEVIKKLSLLGYQIIILTEKGEKDSLNDIKKIKNVKIIYLSKIKLRRTNKYKDFSGKVYKKIKNNFFITKNLRILNNLIWMIKSSKWIISHKKEFDLIWVSKYIDTVSLQMINKFKKIPYVASLEGYDFIEAENARKSQNVFAISDFIKEKCIKDHKFKPEMITIGVDLEKFNNINKKEINKLRKKYAPTGEFLVLNVGRLIEAKDMVTFIKSSKNIVKDYDHVNFLICGNGPEKKKLENLIKKFKLEKRIFIIENLSDQEIINYYKAADIFVHVPKYANHFGVVYIEAMAAGLPIVAADEDATPTTVGNCALLVKKENVKEMSNAIKQLIDDKKLRLKLSKNSLLRSKKEFNWNIIIPKMENIFRKCLFNFK